MKLYLKLIILALLTGLLIFGCSRAGSGDQNKLKDTVVQNLRVEDILNDGGDGLMISWKPLPRDQRVQEYRIYRGVNPDTLFFLASVQVNVKTGVASDVMYYYDSGYNTLIDLTSPGKLKNEKGNQGSILYRGVPRDTKLAARLSECFNLYSQMTDRDYYYHSVKARSASEKDSTVYAGMKFNQQTILASLKSSAPGQTPVKYYYTVVPVNERNQYLGIAKPTSGSPVDDAPDKALGLYCTALNDKKALQFEWEYPLNKDDIGMYAIYAVTAVSDSVWNRMDPGGQLGILAQRGIPIAQGPVGGGSLANYCAVGEGEERPLPPGFSWDAALGARYVIQFQDFGGQASPPSALAKAVWAESKDLPQAAKFWVEDKPMDKGDRLSITWQEPIVSLTKTTTYNEKGTKLKINYQINKTDAQRLSNIYFEFFEPGANKSFAKINEFHQDNIIFVNIPEKYSLHNKATLPTDSLMVKITIAAKPYTLIPKSGRLSYGKSSLIKDYQIVQYLKPDPAMMAYMPTKSLFRNGVDVSSVQNVVYRKGYRGSSYSIVKRNTAYENNLDVTIPYVATVGKGVAGFNFVKGDSLYTYMNGERFSRKLKPGEKVKDLTLVDSEIDLTYDTENETTLSTSIYLDEAKKTVANLNKELATGKKDLADMQATLGKADPLTAMALGQQMAGLQRNIENLEKKIKAYGANKDFKAALARGSDRSMMRYVASVREPELRKFNYAMLKTNGKGLFSKSAPDTTNAGDPNYYSPVSNWFDWNKLLTLFAVIIFAALVVVFVNLAKRGKNLYLRPIAGLQEIDIAVGRATEMGRPMLYCMGNGGLSDVATLASMGILSTVAKRAAEYDTKLVVPCYDYLVMPIAQEIVREAHYAVGRPDSFDKNNVFYLTSVQFAYVAGVNGIMIREKMATNFFMGYFAAEALLMTETGNAVGAVQIAGSDAITQIPFFITTCDYTLIGEELYAASAYLNREPMLLGTLKAQDYFKFLILVFVIAGAILGSFQITGLMQLFPLK